MQDNLKPQLIENNVKYFMNSTLDSCHKFKDKYYNNLYNVGLFIGFFIILGIILFVNYKGNKTTKELEQQKHNDREYIIKQLLKIKKENIDDRKIRNNLITNLPLYNEKI